MPESKLAEKLGFEIRDGRRYIDGIASFGHVGLCERVLWNQCLLLERSVREFLTMRQLIIDCGGAGGPLNQEMVEKFAEMQIGVVERAEKLLAASPERKDA